MGTDGTPGSKPGRGNRKGRTTASQKTDYFRARALGLGKGEAAAKADISRPTALKWENEYESNNGEPFVADETTRGPIAYKDLKPQAKKAWDDFGYFQERYLGRIAVPWQKESAETVAALRETPDREYVVINAPPGSGKSTTFPLDIAAWMTVRQRSLRGMIGSYTETQAKWYVGLLKDVLSAKIPVKAEPSLLALGLAKDAVATISEDFGRMRPDTQDVWQRGQFAVEQFPGHKKKEATWTAWGRTSAFLGGRFDFVIWDDLADPEKVKTVEAQQDLERWWDQYAETRVEPGGLMILQGQRLASGDIYRYALNKKAFIDEDEIEDAAELERLTMEAPSMYKHIVFKAHYEDRCIGNHRLDSPPYPDGCLLYPRRLPWRDLSRIKTNTPRDYQVLYQQEEMDPASVLVNPMWITGGTDTDGTYLPGCRDMDRSIGELPRGVNARDCFSVATADPSPTKYWAIQWWVYNPASEEHYLMDTLRCVMDAPDFLDWNFTRNEFTGVMEEWHHRSQGVAPITHWIVEGNAAQRFMFRYDHMQRWLRVRGVTLIPHQTTNNKNDSERGVETLGPEFKFGRVRLPMKNDGISFTHSQKLVDEVTRYPEGKTDDQVMAAWFYRLHLRNLYRPVKPLPLLPGRPSWLKLVS